MNIKIINDIHSSHDFHYDVVCAVYQGTYPYATQAAGQK